jgi:anaerobic magnesium-protoporphyrin IX monomethyl ester cyclase
MLTLFFPPPWDSFTPYASLPVLLRDLATRGVPARGVDLNFHIMDRLLTPKRLLAARQRLAEHVPEMPNEAEPIITEALFEADETIGKIESAKARLRQRDYSLLSPPKRDWEMLRAATQLLSAPFFPCDWQRNTYWIHGLPKRRPQTLSDVFNHLARPGRDFFEWTYETPEVAPLILSPDTRVAGISLCTLNQLIPAFALCRYIRRSRADIHITMGGPLLRYIQQPLSDTPEVFDYLDSFVVGPGEGILADLYESFVHGQDWRAIPGLTFRGQSAENRLLCYPRPRFDTYAPPDYAAMNVHEYLSDEYEVSYVSSRGCYWGRCAFCSETNGDGGYPYLSKSAATVGREVAAINKTLGVNVVEMTDNAMPLNKALGIARYMRGADSPVHWTMLARMEPKFDYDSLAYLSGSGLRFVSWGIETLSPNVMSLMNKGIKLEESVRILENSKRAGLWNHLFIIVGFPGERKEDMLESLNALANYSELIDSMTLSNYHLQRNSPIFDHPEDFGVRIKSGADQRLDLSYWFDAPDTDVALSLEESYGLFDLFLCNFHFHTANFLGFSTARLCTLLAEHGGDVLRGAFTRESLNRTVEIADLLACT